MKSTLLAIVATMSLSALYSFQNLDNIRVRFLLFERSFPQGVWEIVLFCAGAVLMWLFSLLESWETGSKHKREIKALNDKLTLLQEDKDKLLASVSDLQNNARAATNNDFAENATFSENPETAEHKAE